MSAMARVLGAVRRGTVRAEIVADTGLPGDLVDLIIHENQALATGIDRVEQLTMSAEPATPSCPPVGCRGCFFAQGCPSFSAAPAQL